MLAARVNLLGDTALVLATVVVFAVGAVIIVRVRQCLMARESEGEDDLLTDLQRAYIKGEIDETEFRRIQESLQRQAEGIAKAEKPKPIKPPSDDEIV